MKTFFSTRACKYNAKAGFAISCPIYSDITLSPTIHGSLEEITKYYTVFFQMSRKKPGLRSKVAVFVPDSF